MQAQRMTTTSSVPDLGYAPVPDVFKLPQGVNFGACSGVALDSRGHIYVFNRGVHALLEFDGVGNYLRTLAHDVFSRPHGLRIDAEDHIWATDVGSHIVVKMDPRGRILMVLGLKVVAGEWHQAGHLRAFNEPNDLAFGAAGEIFVTQGHGKGESRVLKFDADDRSNQRIQVFDGDGNYVRESKHPGTPCGLCMCRDRRHIMMAHGHAGRIMKLDLEGNVLGTTGSQGKGPNQYGEAHYLALDAKEDIYVADTLNWRVQKLVRK